MKIRTIQIRPVTDPFAGIPNTDDRLYATTTRPVTKNDIYAAGMRIGELLRDNHIKPGPAQAICDVIRDLEKRAS